MNGGVSALFSSCISAASSSTLPLGRCAFSVPAGRLRSLPLTLTTYSLRRRSASANSAARVEHHLHQALAVPEVHEDHPAVVAATVHPARQADLLVKQGFVDLPAIMATHEKSRDSCSFDLDPPSRCGEGR